MMLSCAGKSHCEDLHECVSVRRTVNQGNSPSSACYRGRTGASYSERKPLQNPNQDRKSAAKQLGKVIFILKFDAIVFKTVEDV